MKRTAFMLLLLLFMGAQTVSSDTGTTGISVQNKEISVSALPSTLKIVDFDPFGSGLDQFDPFLIGDIYRQYKVGIVFDELFTFGVDGSIVPVLATSWYATTDSRTFTINLRDDVFFHDGSKFDANVVKFNIERYTDPSNPGFSSEPLNPFKYDVSSIAVPSENQIEITFDGPYGAFIGDIALTKMVSPNCFVNDGGGYSFTPIGTGPYKYNAAGSSQFFVRYDRFDDYFRGIAPFQAIEWTVYGPDTEDDFISSIGNREMNYIPYVDPSHYEQIEGDSYWETYIDSKFTYEIGFINHRNTLMQDLAVRKAMNHAMDIDDYLKFFGNQGRKSSNYYPPGNIFYDDSITGYAYDPLQANQTLDDAGYPVLADGYRFTIRMVSPSDREDRLLAIAGYLNKVGINTIVDTSNWGDDVFNTKNYDIVLLGVGSVPDGDFTNFYGSSGRNNFGAYSSSEVDEYIFQSRTTVIKQEREYYSNQLQDQLINDAPNLLLMTRPDMNAYDSDVTGHVWRHGLSNIEFSYAPASNLDLDLSSPPSTLGYQNVDIDQSSYFPDAGLVVDPSQQVVLSIQTSYDLSTFVEGAEGSDKYIDIESSTSDSYEVRVYYEDHEINGADPSELKVYRYENDKNWLELEQLENNATFSFIKVSSSGSQLLALTSSSFGQGSSDSVPFSTPAYAIAIIASTVILRRRKVRN